MRKILSIILLTLICLTSSAEVVTLRSGQQVRGEILMKNAEVVIIKTDNGARFQYPMTEVLRIEEEVEEPVVAEEVRTEPLKPVSARIFLAGGAGYVPNEKVGGSVLVDVAIGTRNLAGKRILRTSPVTKHAAFHNHAVRFPVFENGTNAMLKLAHVNGLDMPTLCPCNGIDSRQAATPHHECAFIEVEYCLHSRQSSLPFVSFNKRTNKRTADHLCDNLPSLPLVLRQSHQNKR